MQISKTGFSAAANSRFWAPLPEKQWDLPKAGHLLRRAGFSATPEMVSLAMTNGLGKTVAQLFDGRDEMPLPRAVSQSLAEERRLIRRRRKQKKAQKQKTTDEINRLRRQTVIDYNIFWLQRAADPKFSAHEKYLLFLQNVLVVSSDSVRKPESLIDYQALLRREGLGRYPALVKSVSKSPAMITYLNLRSNEVGRPNENFARELLELFTLGEGNYTEDDVKETARAFTGYKFNRKGFFYAEESFDAGEKKIFGKSGHYNGDQVIDLVFEQPAARSYLPSELIQFYVSAQVAIPPEALQELGEIWQASGFDNLVLLETVFRSRLFYSEQYRGQEIKSPVDYYIGLVQALDLDVAVFPSGSVNLIKRMGQELMKPPNVRGWVGGRSWINATAVRARRAAVAKVLDSAGEESLTAVDLEFVRRLGASKAPAYFVTPDHLKNHLNVNSLHDLGGYLQSQMADPLPAAELNELAKIAGAQDEPLLELMSFMLNHPRFYLC